MYTKTRADSIPILFALLLLLSCVGCSAIQGDINLQGKTDQRHSEPGTTAEPVVVHDPVFIYSYSHDDKPIASGRIVEVNPDGTITLETKQTGESLKFRLDPRGWLLVKPPSPITEEKPK